MRLTELEPRFLTVNLDSKLMTEVDSIKKADGISFLCPKCFDKNGGPIGTHQVVCWQPPVPKSINPSPGRWIMLGNDFTDLTLKAGSSSVFLQGGCRAHFFITDGQIRQC